MATFSKDLYRKGKRINDRQRTRQDVGGLLGLLAGASIGIMNQRAESQRRQQLGNMLGMNPQQAKYVDSQTLQQFMLQKSANQYDNQLINRKNQIDSLNAAMRRDFDDQQAFRNLQEERRQFDLGHQQKMSLEQLKSDLGGQEDLRRFGYNRQLEEFKSERRMEEGRQDVRHDIIRRRAEDEYVDPVERSTINRNEAYVQKLLSDAAPGQDTSSVVNALFGFMANPNSPDTQDQMVQSVKDLNLTPSQTLQLTSTMGSIYRSQQGGQSLEDFYTKEEFKESGDAIQSLRDYITYMRSIGEDTKNAEEELNRMLRDREIRKAKSLGVPVDDVDDTDTLLEELRSKYRLGN